MTETLLSDTLGDDHDPQYSNDGEQIAFRSYRDGDNSVIYVMNADGSSPVAITDPAANARNHAWSPDDELIAFDSNLDGDYDVYAYAFETELTRLITDNVIDDYAPTWYCDSTIVVFTSNISEIPQNSNLFDTNALPIEAPAIDVETEANQLTFDEESDQYPQNTPNEEMASRQETFPSPQKNK
jgi:Tol biopolymer transport system component